jgi:hypothetical protein
LIATAALPPVGADEVVRAVFADLRQASGPLNPLFKRCVGAGRANEGPRVDWQRQFTLARRDPCRSLRIGYGDTIEKLVLLASGSITWRDGAEGF